MKEGHEICQRLTKARHIPKKEGQPNWSLLRRIIMLRICMLRSDWRGFHRPSWWYDGYPWWIYGEGLKESEENYTKGRWKGDMDESRQFLFGGRTC